jgi:hypothetical protein
MQAKRIIFLIKTVIFDHGKHTHHEFGSYSIYDQHCEPTGRRLALFLFEVDVIIIIFYHHKFTPFFLSFQNANLRCEL